MDSVMSSIPLLPSVHCSRGFFYVLSWTAKREGWAGLFRGFLPRLLVAVPGSAFTFATYEIAKRMAMKPIAPPDLNVTR